MTGEHAAGRPGQGERWYVREARQSRPPPGETNGSFTAAEALAGSGMARSCCRRAEAKVDQRQHPGA